MPVVIQTMSRRVGAVVNDGVLFGFRLRLFTLAAELGNVRAACRIFGTHQAPGPASTGSCPIPSP